ncbi:hypothetical protein Q3G72_002824 [Acer saccharum]|nr:hypothetical protein Q3G72_002824 [Acer saccharum]
MRDLDLKMEMNFFTSLKGDQQNYTRLRETKSILVVNDQFPDPPIHVRKGDTVFVNVYNYGDIQIILHWHGVKQPKNPWSDGPEYVTQCPIQPGNNFTYEVIFSSEEGTLRWHAHSDWTRNTVMAPLSFIQLREPLHHIPNLMLKRYYHFPRA